MKDTMPVSLLAQVPYFTSLNETELAALAGQAVRRELTAGQLLLLEGERCSGLYIVEDGWLKSFKTSLSGREQTLRLVGPGHVFSDLSLFADLPNMVTVVALELAIVWLVPAGVVAALLDRRPELARAALRILARRSLGLLALVEDLSLRTVTARLARLLLEQAAEDVVSRRRWTTQAEMASRLGTVPDVLNRALQGLVEEGLIQVDRRQIKICDRKALQVKAELDA